MGTTTRFNYGVTNVAKSSTLGSYVALDPTKTHTYFNDFDTYLASEWTITDQGTGTVALADGNGGWLSVATDVLEDDNTLLQKVGESFLLESGKKAWCKVRFKLSDATQTDIAIGLQVTDASPLDVTDGVYFLKADGSASVSIVERKNATTGSQSAAGIATLANDTFVVLGWSYDGKEEIKYFVDDVHIGTLTSASTYLPDTELTVSFGIQAGSAGAKTLTLDYFLAAVER